MNNDVLEAGQLIQCACTKNFLCELPVLKISFLKFSRLNPISEGSQVFKKFQTADSQYCSTDDRF